MNILSIFIVKNSTAIYLYLNPKNRIKIIIIIIISSIIVFFLLVTEYLNGSCMNRQIKYDELQILPDLTDLKISL